MGFVDLILALIIAACSSAASFGMIKGPKRNVRTALHAIIKNAQSKKSIDKPLSYM